MALRTEDVSSGFAYGYTDSLGQVSGLIPANKSLKLNILDGCRNIIYSNVITLTTPFEVSLNTFAKNRGEFYEGSFSGSFKDASDLSVTHTISCSFRIKR